MSDGFRDLRVPMSRQDVLSLRAGDMITLTGEMVITAGLPTIGRITECLDGKRELPRPLEGTALFHLGSYSEERPDGGLDIHYINPTTSTRFNALMPRLIRDLKLTSVGGKGGLDRASADAMKEVGCVYLSFLGGGATPLTDAIQEVVSVHWNDLIAHFRLVTLKVDKLGPVTVGIDAHGNSLYDSLSQQAQDRVPAIMAGLAEARAAAQREQSGGPQQ